MNSDQENGDARRYEISLRGMDKALRNRLESEGMDKWLFRDMAEKVAEHRRKYSKAHENLQAIASGIQSGAPAFPVKMREFLRWFGAERRGLQINSDIRLALMIYDLHIAPELSAARLDDPISFGAGAKIEYPEGDTPRLLKGGDRLNEFEASILNEIRREILEDRLIGWADEHPDATRNELQAKVDELSKLDLPEIKTPIPTPKNPSQIVDATLRVGELLAANATPLSISRNDTIIAATTTMDQRNLSQLLVVSGRGVIKGMVSWHSVASWLLHGGSRDADVGHCMEPPPREVRDDTPLLEAINELERHRYVLIRKNSDNTIRGIITFSDIVRELLRLSEPFLYLMQIENHLRGLVSDGDFTLEDLRKVNRDPNRYVRQYDDLTLGEYLDLLSQKDSWQKLGLAAVDRKQFAAQLRQATRIRNAVMHFKLDPICSEDVALLRDCAKYLQNTKFRKDMAR